MVINTAIDVSSGRENGLRSRLVEQLFCGVVSGRIAPGERLNIPKLAAGFGVSVTPVREALIELGEAGIVQWQVNRGAVCLPFGPRELHELYELRRILEVEAIERAAAHMTYQELLALRDQTRSLLDHWNTDSAYPIDRAMHRLFADRCGNSRLRHELYRYDQMMGAMCRSVNNADDSLRCGIEEHMTILDALLARDTTRARMLLSQHIIATAHRIDQALFANKPPAEVATSRGTAD
jgi:DNA-binding GntR family transcriptional regulator